jgi:hypothetical protein
MKESGFCINCEREISTQGCTVVRLFGNRCLIIGADGRAHHLHFKKKADEQSEGETDVE